MEKLNVDVAQLGKIIAYDQDSAEVPLANLWQENTAVLVFIRHFG